MEDFKFIEKVSVTPIPEINGSIVNGTNFVDKEHNTYSAGTIDTIIKNLPKDLFVYKTGVSAVPVADGYSYQVTKEQLGVADCTKYMWVVDASNWQYMFTNITPYSDYITVRFFKVSGTSNGTLTLQKDSAELTNLMIKGVRIP